MTAHNYDEALKQFKVYGDKIELIFSDFGLPRVDGVTVCSKLRERKPGLRVLMASGYSPTEFKVRMDEFGEEVFLPKPYRANELLQRVRKALDSSAVAK